MPACGQLGEQNGPRGGTPTHNTAFEALHDCNFTTRGKSVRLRAQGATARLPRHSFPIRKATAGGPPARNCTWNSTFARSHDRSFTTGRKWSHRPDSHPPSLGHAELWRAGRRLPRYKGGVLRLNYDGKSGRRWSCTSTTRPSGGGGGISSVCYYYIRRPKKVVPLARLARAKVSGLSGAAVLFALNPQRHGRGAGTCTLKCTGFKPASCPVPIEHSPRNENKIGSHAENRAPMSSLRGWRTTLVRRGREFGGDGRICTCTDWFLRPAPLLLGYIPVKWCRRQESHLHWQRSHRCASADWATPTWSHRGRLHPHLPDTNGLRLDLRFDGKYGGSGGIRTRDRLLMRELRSLLRHRAMEGNRPAHRRKNHKRKRLSVSAFRFPVSTKER